MLKFDVHRRRSKLPACYREEVESQREQFFTSGKTGEALTAILRYAKLPRNLNVCEQAFEVAGSVICGWIRERPSSDRSAVDVAHRCEYTAHRVEHARNWGNSLLRRQNPERRASWDKDAIATRFITTIRDAADTALPALRTAYEDAQRRAHSQAKLRQGTLFSN